PKLTSIARPAFHSSSLATLISPGWERLIRYFCETGLDESNPARLNRNPSPVSAQANIPCCTNGSSAVQGAGTDTMAQASDPAATAAVTEVPSSLHPESTNAKQGTQARRDGKV